MGGYVMSQLLYNQFMQENPGPQPWLNSS
jgi:hypothetical protein